MRLGAAPSQTFEPDNTQYDCLWHDHMAGHLFKGQEEIGNRLGLQVGAPQPRQTLRGGKRTLCAGSSLSGSNPG